MSEEEMRMLATLPPWWWAAMAGSLCVLAWSVWMVLLERVYGPVRTARPGAGQHVAQRGRRRASGLPRTFIYDIRHGLSQIVRVRGAQLREGASA